MARKISNKGLRKKLDDIIRERVRERDKHTCQWCGKANLKGLNSQVSHTIPKGRCTYLRWDMLNVLLLCMYCHSEMWHKRSLGRQWWDAKYPDRLEYVEANQYKIVKYRKFMDETLERLTNEE